MSSPFLCAEPVSLEKQEKPKPTPEQHPDVSKAIDSFSKLVENSDDVSSHWDFIIKYINLIGDNQPDILPVFNSLNNSNETNPFSFIYKYSGSGKDFTLSTFFLSIVKVCTDVAQNKIDENTGFILQCLMLANDNNSPVFSYTELLNKIQHNDLYKELNEKFLEKYQNLTSEYIKPKTEKQNENQMEEELEKTNDEKQVGFLSNGKMGIAFSVFAIIIVLSALIYYFVIMKNGSPSDLLADM